MRVWCPFAGNRLAWSSLCPTSWPTAVSCVPLMHRAVVVRGAPAGMVPTCRPARLPAGVSDRQVHVLGTAWESCLHGDVDRDSCPPVSASGLAWRPRAHRADRSAAPGVRGVGDEPGTGRTDGRREAPFTASKAPSGLEGGQERTWKPSSGKGDRAPSTSLALKSGKHARGPKWSRGGSRTMERLSSNVWGDQPPRPAQKSRASDWRHWFLDVPRAPSLP